MAFLRKVRFYGRTCVIFWLLLVATSAHEIYDDLPPGVLDMVGQEDEYLMDTILDPEPELFRPRDLLLYRLIKSLQGGGDNYSYSRLWSSTYQKPINRFDKNTMGTMESDVITKRLTEGMRQSGTAISLNPVQKVRPQEKWKTKKGKGTGTHMICYFKLCAFRSPLRK